MPSISPYRQHFFHEAGRPDLSIEPGFHRIANRFLKLLDGQLVMRHNGHSFRLEALGDFGFKFLREPGYEFHGFIGCPLHYPLIFPVQVIPGSF